MLARLAILLVALSFAAPATVLAQAGPFQGIPPAQQEPTTTESVTLDKLPNSADEDEGLSGLAKAAIVAFGALLLLGIAWLIMRDARTRAPVAETEGGPKGTTSPQRHARARAKAKAAKQQRKRNRARR
jgi:hypothetical protein